MNEKDLRMWTKKVMGSDVSWIEPTLGSSVGRPDADFNINGVIFPVELKWAEEKEQKTGGTRLVMNLRPAQIRFHVMSAQKGMKTAIMYGLETKAGMIVEMVAGVWVQKLFPRWLVAMPHETHAMARFRIERLFASKEFWR